MVRLIEDSDNDGELFGFLCDLLLADWESPEGPLRLRTDLELVDLAGARFFTNARIFLAALAENDGAPITATGNLSRVFVSHMFDRMELPADVRESIRRYNKVLNEEDLGLLHLVRVVSQCGRLIARRKKRFRLRTAGRALLPEEQAGALYRALFIAYFRRFDLRYLQFRDVPGIQDTAAAILWRLDAVAQDWTPVRTLAPRVLLPRVLDQLQAAMVSEYDSEDWILAGYILNPLFDFGLIETKKNNVLSQMTDQDSIRVTALWRKFIGFAEAGDFPP